MRINEVSELTQLSKETIRYYEKCDLLSPERQENGYRNYQEKELKDIHFITQMKRLNLTLNDIRSILQLKNRETSLVCKNETLSFIENFSESIDRQLEFLNKADGIIKEIRIAVTTSDGTTDDQTIISLLEKFEEES